jgi:hypothetical protein
VSTYQNVNQKSEDIMPKQTLQNLISNLHDQFGDDETSAQQQQLMQALESHIHGMDEAAPVDPNVQETLTLLLDDVEVRHPQAAGIIREVMEALKNMGI